MTRTKGPGYETTGAVIGLVAGIAIFQLLLAPFFEQASGRGINAMRLVAAGLVGAVGTGIGYFLGSWLARSANRAGGA
jgi:hypothetical protein